MATGRWRTTIIAVSVLGPFLGLPGGRVLVQQLIHSDPLSLALAFLVCLGVLLTPLGRWSSSWRSADGDDSWDEPAVLPQLAEI